MSRGVLSGFVAGSAASTAVIALVSVLSTPPSAPLVTAQAPSPAPAPESGEVAPGVLPVPSDVNATQSSTPVAQAAPTAPEAATGSPDVGTEELVAVARPETAEISESLPAPAPEVAGADGILAVQDLSPVYPNPKARQPAAPDADAPATVASDPAQAPVSEPVEVQPVLSGSAVVEKGTDAQVDAPIVPAPEGDVGLVGLRPDELAVPADPTRRPAVSEVSEPVIVAADIPKRVAEAKAGEASDAADQVGPVANTDADQLNTTADDMPDTASSDAAVAAQMPVAAGAGIAPDVNVAEAAPEAEDAPGANSDVNMADAVPEVDAEAVPAPDVIVAEAAPEVNEDAARVAERPQNVQPEQRDIQTSEPEIAPSGAMGAPVLEAGSGSQNRIRIGVPATTLLDGERVTRAALPQLIVGTGSQAETVAPTRVQAPQPDGPALQQYSVAFDASDGRPLMSIVLMDTGQNIENGPVALDALSGFPYPLTFAIDASLPDAADRTAMYRANGFEVMALVDLPANLTAADTEVALAAALDSVPEAVAVMEGVGSGLQGSKEISDQVNLILQDTGHGIVWQPKGLDTAQKLAAREGIASQTMFRDLDSSGQTAVVIRRFLDQAAFKAGQQGSVIMLGRLQPDTISALLVWGLQSRASRVAIAPVSSVLQVPAESG